MGYMAYFMTKLRLLFVKKNCVHMPRTIGFLSVCDFTLKILFRLLVLRMSITWQFTNFMLKRGASVSVNLSIHCFCYNKTIEDH